MVKCEECDEAEGTEITKLIGTTPQIVGQGGVVMAPKEVKMEYFQIEEVFLVSSGE